ncbi:TetR/AcrR family transcriptional regulator [bacterium]|nr:TetR/AcrR family transcriptional regulator [bacterium]
MDLEKKENIIESAQKLFSRFGFLKTTVDEIAKAARMGKASLHHYFKSKEDIFREVVKKESQILSGKTREAIEFGKTPSPAPPDLALSLSNGWKPAEWDVFATSDEPFFEFGPLAEGNTFAFRGRAKNSTGYGGYSEIWVVEVV